MSNERNKGTSRTSAAEQLVSHAADAYTLAFRITCNQADAEDAVQDAYRRVLKSSSPVPAEPGARRWFLRVVANAAITLRAESRARTHREQSKAMDNQRHYTDQQSNSPVEGVTELREVLGRAMNELEEKYRLPLSAHYELGLSFEEAAVVLDVPASTLRTRAGRGLDRMREKMGVLGVVASESQLATHLEQGLAAPVSESLQANIRTIVSADPTPGLSSASPAVANVQKLLTSKSVCVAALAAMLISGALVVGGDSEQPAKVAKPVAPVEQTSRMPQQSGDAETGDEKQEINKALQERLDRRIKVIYRRDYFHEVLEDLARRGDLRFAFPGTIDVYFAFTHEDRTASVGDVLGKLCKEAKLLSEFHGEDLVILWKKAKDERLKELATKLRSADAQDRREAAFDLGQLADPRIYPLLFETLKDPDPSVAAWAVQGLLPAHTETLGFGAGATKAATTVLELMKKPGSVAPRRVLVRLLGATRSEAAVEPLVRLLRDPDLKLAAVAASGLGQIGDPRAEAHLIELAKKVLSGECIKPDDQGFWFVCSSVVNGLAELRTSRGLAELLRFAEQREWCEVVVSGLSHFREPSVSRLLVQQIMRYDHRVPSAISPNCAPDVLRQYADEETETALLAILEEGRRDRYHLAFRSLARPLEGRMVDKVRRLTTHGSAVVRASALELLGFTRDPRAIRTLEAHLRDGNFYVRHAAATALAHCRSPGADKALRELYGAWGKKELYHYLSALRALRDPETVPFLLKHAADGSPLLKKEIARALLVERSPSAVDPLLQLMRTKPSWLPNPKSFTSSYHESGLTKTDPSMRYGIDSQKRYLNMGGALVIGGSLRTNPHLSRQLRIWARSEDTRLRKLAAQWLGRRPVPPANADVLLALTEDSEAEVRRAAIRGLDSAPRSPRMLPVLARLTSRVSDEDKVLVTRILGASNEYDPRVRRHLVDLLKDENPMVRREAALPLWRAGDSQALPVMADLLRQGSAPLLFALLVQTRKPAADKAVRSFLATAPEKQLCAAYSYANRLLDPRLVTTALRLAASSDRMSSTTGRTYLQKHFATLDKKMQAEVEKKLPDINRDNPYQRKATRTPQPPPIADDDF